MLIRLTLVLVWYGFFRLCRALSTVVRRGNHPEPPCVLSLLFSLSCPRQRWPFYSGARCHRWTRLRPDHAEPGCDLLQPRCLGSSRWSQTLFDVQAASVRIDVDSWRNGGFDPNTGEPYNTATARVIAPVMFLGGSYEILEDQLTAGLGLTMPFLGGGDYTSGEEEAHRLLLQSPALLRRQHQGHHRPGDSGAGATRRSRTGTLSRRGHDLHHRYLPDHEELHHQGGLAWHRRGPSTVPTMRSRRVRPPVHTCWTAGIFFDKYEKVLGVSRDDLGGEFNGTGEGSVDFPGFLVSTGEP